MKFSVHSWTTDSFFDHNKEVDLELNFSDHNKTVKLELNFFITINSEFIEFNSFDHNKTVNVELNTIKQLIKNLSFLVTI